ncbi:MAG: secondary thiamine-phosphate synthase enzyme YjbQ [Bacillota bacterium]
MVKTTTLTVNTNASSEFVNITREVEALLEKHPVENGFVTLFVPHTTAGVTINENADPDVQNDMVKGLNQISPKLKSFEHFEGNSDAHIKSTLVGASEHVLIKDGRLVLGTWQGIYFAEFDGPRTRKLHVQLQGNGR